MILQPGRLNRRVTIQSPVEGSPQQDAGGSSDAAWTDVATVWAAIEPLKGREFLQAQQTAEEVTGKITIRHSRDFVLDATMRFKYVDPVSAATRYYDIQAAVNDGEENRLVIAYVREGPNNG